MLDARCDTDKWVACLVASGVNAVRRSVGQPCETVETERIATE